MTKSTSKLIYKPDSQSTEEYIIYVNPEEYAKYAAGDTTIPMVDVVDSYEVFVSTQGNQGILGKASKQQLENVFTTARDDDIAKFMLEHGVLHHADRIGNKAGNTNQSRGGAVGSGKGPSY